MSPAENILLVDDEDILLVDDEDVVRRLCGRILARLGRPFVETDSVRDALGRLARQERFGLLITDLRLPDGDGREVVRAFRERFPDAPVVVITGTPDFEEAAKKDLGAKVDAFVSKPFDVARFEETVRRFLGGNNGQA